MTPYQKIFANNKQWAATKQANDQEFFTHLAKGQDPDFLYIGCSDSRVTAEDMMGATPGEVFVHRNIANVISNSDLSAMSVIEYAVKYLKVKHIVVCGHYGCGGVQAAMQPLDMGVLNPWLRNIRDVYRLHHDELDAMTDESDRYQRLVELNVEEQAFNVIKTAVVQNAYLQSGYPQVHGWIFDVSTGLLKDLDIDFLAKLDSVREVYDLGGNR
ncbi:MAG: carbonic anhydrase [Gammaproteobacteria bacterium]|nr:carbonic anhydrase [Gammaproteobacteria bacterium]NNC98120.1 carbonic anhydrase [Gammaproteobacteria bacterium]NNM13184.1 carbonic anhydrase [Gammaproteobacteria bacterium]